MKTTPSNHNTIKSSESVRKVSPCWNHTQTRVGKKRKRPWCPRQLTNSPCGAPEAKARRQRFYAELVGDSPTSQPRRRHQSCTRAANWAAARRSGARRRRTTGPDPRLNRLCRPTKITLFAFVYFEVSFVLCSGHFCFISQTTGNRWTSRLPSCCRELLLWCCGKTSHLLPPFYTPVSHKRDADTAKEAAPYLMLVSGYFAWPMFFRAIWLYQFVVCYF